MVRKRKQTRPSNGSWKSTIASVATIGIAIMVHYSDTTPVEKCADLADDCKERVGSGRCATPELLQHCANSCGLCAPSCTRVNRTPALVSDSLVPLFSRMSRHAEFAPKVLHEDPPVLQFNNFLDAEESRALRSHCDKYERSLAGDSVMDSRTSQQCWCTSASCMADPVVKRVISRIHMITETHPNTAEFLQLVRYTKNQFYRVHHDQNAAPSTPQGPRILTVFMYLNTPALGGSTRFNDINMTVDAVEGRAIIWPSVTNADPTVADMRTHHEALPVEEGEKHGANMWIHLYDWQGPSRRGCAVSHHNTFAPDHS